VVSDFSLMDAIESGIIKLPRVPVTSTRHRAIPVSRSDPRWILLMPMQGLNGIFSRFTARRTRRRPRLCLCLLLVQRPNLHRE
jgi:hypothetical protein